MPNNFLTGVVVGACLVVLPGALWAITMQGTGTAQTMMGDEAEQWTASELRGLARRGWRLVNHVALRKDDIDHVLLGPGGAFAIETKWSSSWDSTYGRQRTLKAVCQARENARTLRLWHPFKSLEIAPSPVLVLWGRGLSDWDEGDRVRVMDGVIVVNGLALRRWTRSLGDSVLPVDRIAAGWSALEAQVARRDPAERLQHPLPVSVAEGTARLSLAVGSAALGLTAFGQILSRTQSLALTLTLACVLILPAGLLLRSATWRWAAWSWSLGVGLPGVALLAAEVIALAR